VNLQLESISQQRLQHRVCLLGRCTVFPFGRDIESVAGEPRRSTENLKRLHLIRTHNHLAHGHVDQREPSSGLHPDRHKSIA
jgi:hypothetical protein